MRISLFCFRFRKEIFFFFISYISLTFFLWKRDFPFTQLYGDYLSYNAIICVSVLVSIVYTFYLYLYYAMLNASQLICNGCMVAGGFTIFKQ